MTDYNKRKQEMIKMRQEKLMTLQEIADIVGLTRQRVHQILGAHTYIDGGRLGKRRDYIESCIDKTNDELAKELGLYSGYVSTLRNGTRHAIKAGDTAPSKGREAEDIVITILSNHGYEVEYKDYLYEYDLLINGIVRCDVKSSCALYKTNPGIKSNQYRFRIRQDRRDKCDIYILYMGGNDKDIFIVPTDKVPDKYEHIQMCYPTLRPDIGKYQQYKNRFDIIDKMLEEKSHE